MIRVGLARTRPSYADLTPPYGPGSAYPELAKLQRGRGAAPAPEPLNPAFAAVRASLRGLGLDSARFGTPEWSPLGDLTRPGRRIVLKPNFIRHWNPKADTRSAPSSSLR